MERLAIKCPPKYECLVEAAQKYPELDPLTCMTFMQMLRVNDGLLRVMDELCAKNGTTQGRFLLMILLFDRGSDCPVPRTPAELAEMAGVSRATITGLLDSLEKDGYVSRQPDSRDRRMMLVELTAAGRAYMVKVMPSQFLLMREVMQPLSKPEMETLLTLLSKLSGHLESTSKTSADS